MCDKSWKVLGGGDAYIVFYPVFLLTTILVYGKELEAPIMGEEVDKLMMWKYCTECELITPIVPVTVETWSLSFAMFLHIIFHENQLTRRGSDR